ncbi:lysine--tRNA ligase, partial [Candidatus Azambacteria bacterium RIFCSPLOWO2_01_FULL_44_84]
MTSLEELRETRIKKLQALEKAGLVAYPAKISRAQTVGEILEKFLLFWITKKSVLTAGRIKTLRTHGGITFADLEDFSGRIQLLFSKEALEKTAYQNLLDYFDIGDFIEVSGTVLKTKLGEKTIKAQRFAMAAKTLRPLPEKWHGLQDVEERFRRRYLDLLMNPETKKKLLNRSVITKAIRDYLDGGGFLEVETPILQNLAGGAAAKPFKTHLNTLDLELYLRVAPELYLKRMLIGGWEKIYEIGKNFRNEGIDASHNPEFTMLEAYIAYENSEYLKTFIKNLLQTVVKKINNGNATVRYEDKEIDFSGDWKETDYSDLVKKFEDQARPDEGVTAWDIAKKTLIQPTV